MLQQCSAVPWWDAAMVFHKSTKESITVFVRGGVNDESAVDSIVEIEGWRLPRVRRDVYDEEVKVGSESDRAVGVQ
jgi:hypothetical protein